MSLQVSYSHPLALRALQRPGAAMGREPDSLHPRAGLGSRPGGPRGAGLEWLLLSDQPITDFAQALICARQYASRWLTEDFHKALKTGLGTEKLQLQTAERLLAAVALLSVVALALVDMREKSRLEPDLPAEAAGLTANELRVLRHQRRRPLATVREVYLALAALGGRLGCKGDGPPGWQTLWLGRRSLRLLVEGVNIVVQLLEE